MNAQDARKLLTPLFKMKEMEILERFAGTSPTSIFTRPKHNDHASVFIPGTRKDRVLLVAHVDTVWHDSPKIEVGYGDGEHNIFFSDSRRKGLDEDNDPILTGMGIGADDRAGVGLLWLYRKLGHSLLLVNGEEKNTMGSRYLMSNENLAGQMQEHQFAVEFDRRGSNDMVFYYIWTKKFKEYCLGNTKYNEASGTNTDICVLCKDICGVNISVGYYNEHSVNEILDVNHWLRTYKVAGQWLSQRDLPRFKQ